MSDPSHPSDAPSQPSDPSLAADQPPLPSLSSPPLSSLSSPPSSSPPSSPAAPGALRTPGEVECWGHRGASAHLPENTLASFQAAILEGAHGIESDVHATLDGVILMFHDPTLDRTTTGKGLIRKQPWEGVIEHVRTTKEPVQPIPRFEELIDLLMEEGNRHVLLNIDCKMQNDPEKLFPEMARIISTHADWETLLAPRLILGLWHPLFIRAAYTHLPLLKRYHIGFSLSLARQFFWDACEGFSIAFPLLIGAAGQAFIRDCVKAGKSLCVWTVNDPAEMRVALGWGVRAVLTDRVAVFVALRNEASCIAQDPEKLQLPGLSKYYFTWSNWKYYGVTHAWIERTQLDVMRTMCYQPGPLVMPDLGEFSMEPTHPVAPVSAIKA